MTVPQSERDRIAEVGMYRPEFEAFGNYVPTIVPRRYDAFLYLDRTRALHPLHPSWPGSANRPDTFPFGV